MMMIRKGWILAVLLSACAAAPQTVTHYHPQKRGDGANPWGYTDSKMREGTYLVAATYWDTATAVAMFDRRAGELCGAEGYREFTYSREMIYSVAVAPAAVFPPGSPKVDRPQGVTREAVVACTKRAG
jgi:hypothetical protein